MEDSFILRKHGTQTNTKEQMEGARWIGPPGGPIWNKEVKAMLAEMFSRA
jgi:hypothetical protein